MPEFCRIEREGPVTTITIDRPDVMNAIHPPASRELSNAFDEFVADPTAWVAILTGAGDRAFSAGNDLKFQAGGGKMEWPPSGFAGITARWDNAKPVIAAVNGLALGGGFEIVLACDIAVASEKASFGLPEPRVGLAALAGGLHRLPRQIGMKAAMGMLLTGRRVDAREALALGIVNEVVPPADVLGAARRWAEQICECSPVSVRTSKRVALEGLRHASLQEAMDTRYEAIVELVKSADFVEGPLAFSQKRKPNWTGK
jgi:enoyl-CoA hydratase/carnithine racemase